MGIQGLFKPPVCCTIGSMSMVFRLLTKEVFIDAIEANLIAKALSFPRFFGGVVDGPNPLWFVTGNAMPANNGVVSAIFAPDKVEESIQRMLDKAAGRGKPLTWWLGPSSSPPDLGVHLLRFGFTQAGQITGMAMDLHRLEEPQSPQPSLRVTWAQDRAALARWLDVLQACCPQEIALLNLDILADVSLRSDSEWQHYLAWQAEEVVAAGSLFLGAGVAGLYHLAACPQARRPGLEQALAAHACRQALQQGFQIATLYTSRPETTLLYQPLGFEVYCQISQYRYTPAGGNGRGG
jgi:GNAT superfamily N-acetyltransferase